MELKDFVKETLMQISEGVEAAQIEVRECGGFVNPAHRASIKGSHSSHFGSTENGQNIFLVDFDVSVTAIEEAGTNAQAKLKVANLLNLGAGGESSQSNSATNKICFKVPLGLPVDSVSEEQLKERDARVDESRRRRESLFHSNNRRRLY